MRTGRSERSSRSRVSVRRLLIAGIVALPALIGSTGALAAGPPDGGKGPGYCTSYSGGETTNPPLSLDDVYACQGSTTGATYFDSPGAGVYAWQCVELSERFLWVVEGWTVTSVQYGSQLVDQGHNQHPSVPVGRPGPGSVPVAGDVISFQPTRGGFVDSTAGHTAVVVSGNQGTGDFTILSENFPDGSAAEQNLHVDVSGGHNGEVSLNGGSWTSADWLELASPAVGLHGGVALIPGGGGAGYELDGFGAIHPFGGAPAVSSPSSALWPGWDIARGIAISPGSSRAAVTGYVLDGYGGVHPFAAGSASLPPGERSGPYWSSWDIARAIVLSSPASGYVLDGYGGVHPWAGGSTALPPGVNTHGAYWPNWDIARAIVLSTPTSGYVLDGYGGLHPFAGGGASTPRWADSKKAPYWPNWDIARGVALSTPDSGYVLDGWGGLHSFGPVGTRLPQAVSTPGYSPGHDVFKGAAFDPATGAGVEVRQFMSDMSGGQSYSFSTPRTRAHTAVALIKGGRGAGYELDGYGRIHPFGGAPTVKYSSGSWPGWDIARGIAITPGSSRRAASGYVLDGYGGVHPFAAGSAARPPGERKGAGPYWPNWDIARAIVLSTAHSGYVMDGYGGIHPFAAGKAPLPPGVRGSGYWPDWDIARALVLSTPTSGYQLDGFGGIHPFAGGRATMPSPPNHKTAPYWSGWDIARGIALVGPHRGYVLDGWGGIHPFAPAGTRLPPISGTPLYWPGWDVFDTIAYDPRSGIGVTANAAYLGATGGTRSRFRGPKVRSHHRR
jgi:hypothetical protein